MGIFLINNHEKIIDWRRVKTASLGNVKGVKPNHENIKAGIACGLGRAGNRKSVLPPYACFLIKVLIQVYISSTHIQPEKWLHIPLESADLNKLFHCIIHFMKRVNKMACVHFTTISLPLHFGAKLISFTLSPDTLFFSISDKPICDPICLTYFHLWVFACHP